MLTLFWVSWSLFLLLLATTTGPMLEWRRVDVVVVPGPLLLADLESVLLDAESDKVPGPLLLADLESVLLGAESDDFPGPLLLADLESVPIDAESDVVPLMEGDTPLH